MVNQQKNLRSVSRSLWKTASISAFAAALTLSGCKMKLIDPTIVSGQSEKGGPHPTPSTIPTPPTPQRHLPFSTTYDFAAGSEGQYLFPNSVEISPGGTARLKLADQADANVSNFSAGTSTGVAWDPSGGFLRLSGDGANTNTSELSTDWTPKYANLVQYYRMNGAVGAISNGAAIPAQVGAAGAISGSGLSYVAGKMREGIGFGSAASLNATFNTAPNLNNFTAIAWFNTTSAVEARILTDGNAIRALEIYGGRFHICYMDSDCRISNTMVNDGQWHFVAVTSNGTNATAYLDGKVVPEMNAPSHAAAFGPAFSIGADANGGNPFAGTIDEVAVFSTQLSAAEIRLIYERQSAQRAGTFTSRLLDGFSSQSWQTFALAPTLPFGKLIPDAACTAPCTHNAVESASTYPGLISANGSRGDSELGTGLIGLWHLNETGGSTAVDASGQGHNGSLTGNMSYGEECRFGKCAQFNGYDGRILLGNPSLYENLSEFTLSIWMYADRVGSQMSLFSKELSYKIRMSGGGALDFWTNAPSNGWSPLTSSTILTAHRWYHIVATYDGTTKRIYIDGIPEPTTGNASGSLQTAGEQLAIGADPGSSDGFNGNLSEAGLWSRALSPREIIELYRRGGNRLKYQVRTCTTATAAGNDCADDPNGAAWKGPDGTRFTYFSELANRETPGANPTGKFLNTGPTFPLGLFLSPPETHATSNIAPSLRAMTGERAVITETVERLVRRN